MNVKKNVLWRKLRLKALKIEKFQWSNSKLYRPKAKFKNQIWIVQEPFNLLSVIKTRIIIEYRKISKYFSLYMVVLKFVNIMDQIN